VKGPYLLFLPTTGIVDSVNSQRPLPPLLASYIFASPAASKFIAEQVPSHATYINQIPSQILGNSYPLAHMSEADDMISRSGFTSQLSPHPSSSLHIQHVFNTSATVYHASDSSPHRFKTKGTSSEAIKANRTETWTCNWIFRTGDFAWPRLDSHRGTSFPRLESVFSRKLWDEIFKTDLISSIYFAFKGSRKVPVDIHLVCGRIKEYVIAIKHSSIPE
jgi:hypothetical protein